MRLLILDANPESVGDVRLLFLKTSQFEVQAITRTLDEALARLSSMRPDIMLIEILNGDCHAIDSIRKVLSRFHSLKIVVWSCLPEVIYAERVFLAGAMGYVMKNAPQDQFLYALQCVGRNELHVSGTVGEIMIRRYLKCSDVDVQVDSLTNQELKVFELLGKSYDLDRISKTIRVGRLTAKLYCGRIQKKLKCGRFGDLERVAQNWVRTHHVPLSQTRVAAL